jgi:hypothetical protein
MALRERGHDLQNEKVATFDVDFFLTRRVEHLEMGIHIRDINGHWAFGINSDRLDRVQHPLERGSYRVSHHLLINLPFGSYTAGFAFAEVTPEGKKELAWSDRKCEFEVREGGSRRCTGYALMSADVTLSRTRVACEDKLVPAAIGRLDVIGDTSGVQAGTSVQIAVAATNRGMQSWSGDLFRPIRFSYHWRRSSGEVEVFEGRRTALPAGGIPAGQTVRADVHVDMPRAPGRYQLEVTLVQENFGWLEAKGLGSAKVDVDVV